jgi:hypothetical protein
MCRFLICCLVLLAGSVSTTLVRGDTYEGTWNTTNRKLDGTMTCVVRQLDDQKWSGRFYGIWQGVDFDYTVTFTGPRSDLQGTATIDGAEYGWRGVISDRSFRGSFQGTRYDGYFVLVEKKAAR